MKSRRPVNSDVMPLNAHRITKAIVIVLLAWLAMAIIAWLLVDVIGVNIPERVVTILGYLFGWPLLLLNPFIPRSDIPGRAVFLLRIVLYLLVVLLDLTLYSSLTYFILQWRANKRLPRSLTSDAA